MQTHSIRGLHEKLRVAQAQYARWGKWGKSRSGTAEKLAVFGTS